MWKCSGRVKCKKDNGKCNDGGSRTWDNRVSCAGPARCSKGVPTSPQQPWLSLPHLLLSPNVCCHRKVSIWSPVPLAAAFLLMKHLLSLLLGIFPTDSTHPSYCKTGWMLQMWRRVSAIRIGIHKCFTEFNAQMFNVQTFNQRVEFASANVSITPSFCLTIHSKYLYTLSIIL